ncbi:chlorophyll synthesis pathway protein BchC [Methylobacterium sp. E-041]|uniref:chlorophyll synthesis pathway protein BchC n=1 Tax=unclassified Methylobacterium TaxID=2615210 RepID=UPI0011C87FF9|nr:MULTISPECIES: chlorophyll synthesis pathway protein BchC [unclassified Methylobacterium]MCJ2009353.1 chlorophyll synthesis pathway protein BchC [Methylobacterium sp. J-092]MCJ2106654.1 chlorophyll synthesis pathway protein BchC [Methylobacterium sp. E-041]MCJ2114654.1 chlorophyll synthesis pathway protein BchC [Methylobacterium sp. E-025]TXN38718.1 chlorophyll synthesis pathway protein BchC [Methylobacterium sp. WL93]TXN48506.1 chlorophyll synthesis pathway protein BchC [Methylobacterium sp
MDALAVVLEKPEVLALNRLPLTPAAEGDAVVAVTWSGISTGTERLLWTGRMPSFPGMGYPLVPGYESVGTVESAPAGSDLSVGQAVFVPGARCFGTVRGLFGGAASHLIVPAEKLVPVDPALGEKAILLALAATAYHAMASNAPGERSLIVGHGVLGRLLARLTALSGAMPTVWETNPVRARGEFGYPVIHPDQDERRDYATITDVSGDASLLDTLIGRLCSGGEIVLAGFYEAPLAFAFPPAFLREARIRVAAEFRPHDLAAVSALVARGALSLDGLITHRRPASEAEQAYRTAFGEPECLKMILDWRNA